MASQFNVGYKAVEDSVLPPFEQLYLTGWYRGDWYGPGPDGLFSYEQDNPAPVMKGPFHNGPDTVYHLLDKHHRTTALYLLSQVYTTSTTVTVTGPSGQPETVTIGPAPSSVYVEETADWSTKPTDQFWADMLEGNTGGVVSFAPVDAAGSFAKPRGWACSSGVGLWRRPPDPNRREDPTAGPQEGQLGLPPARGVLASACEPAALRGWRRRSRRMAAAAARPTAASATVEGSGTTMSVPLAWSKSSFRDSPPTVVHADCQTPSPYANVPRAGFLPWPGTYQVDTPCQPSLLPAMLIAASVPLTLPASNRSNIVPTA
jgi:hypothetical protein